jgi:hypothetical protein
MGDCPSYTRIVYRDDGVAGLEFRLATGLQTAVAQQVERLRKLVRFGLKMQRMR